LAGTVASQRLRGVASSLGCGANDRLDRPEQEDEQRLREVMCERGSVGVRCHDPPHDEAARPHLRTFHTVSSSSTLAIWLHGKAHSFRFLGCPGDFLRVGVGGRHEKSPRSLHTGRNRLLSRWCGGGGDGTRGVPTGRLTPPGNRALEVSE
jgi:hypothetical protein